MRKKEMSTGIYEELILGIGYYKREEWKHFLASAEDREKLEDTYDEWLIDFNKAVANAKAVGFKPKKVTVNLDELINYCAKRGLKNNADTRCRFFAELTRQGRAEEIT